MDHFISSIILGISLAAPVGPVCIELVRRGINGGFFNGLSVGLGAMSADFIFMIFIFLGLHQFLQQVYVQFFMYGIGAIILLYLALQSFLNNQQLTTLSTPLSHKHSKLRYSYGAGLFIALLNPINILFWFAIYGSILSEQIHQPLTILFGSSLSIFIGIFIWNLNLAFLAHFLSHIMKPSYFRYMNICAAVILTYFSVHFFIKAFLLI
ncbi:putative amino acid transporter [Bacillus sp. TS-2]|nr:putative amino acid transporter [Bacillus sp. TS-2]